MPLTQAVEDLHAELREPCNDLAAGEVSALVASLTPRKREIMGLMAEGLANKESAARLGISEKNSGGSSLPRYEQTQGQRSRRCRQDSTPRSVR